MTPLRSRSSTLFGLALVGALGSGCAYNEPTLPEQLERGYVVMLPGVRSEAWQFADTLRGLREAGLDRAVEIIEWGDHPFGSLNNLVNIETNRKRAKSIADKIGRYAQDHTGAPITLVGYSGGGGMAVLVTEALPDHVRLDRLILMAAAISPEYELGPVLKRCKRGVVNLYSKNDWFMVGFGTRVMGTIDRKNTPSAGHVGFRTAGGALKKTVGLTQIAWAPSWRDQGHWGTHTGWLAKKWAKQTLAPLIDPTLPRPGPRTETRAPAAENQRTAEPIGYLTVGRLPRS